VAIEEQQQATASLLTRNTLPAEISCKVCFTQKVSHLMIPCFCVCETCAIQLNALLMSKSSKGSTLHLKHVLNVAFNNST